MVHIEIDGQKVEVPQGSTIIEVADNLNIPIPRFCYHNKLSIAANCRMCLVEVEKAPKPLPACATPVTEGMKVWTRSPKTIMAQKSVMEFLLINHPLDCPICDQGGECELQDVAMGYGNDVSEFFEGKRAVEDKDIGPLIATEMTRCIHCTRCVRFGDEIAGVRELGATGRGEWTEIGTYIGQAVDNEVSGNVIDLCPVGALTSKPYRFQARSWEMSQHAAVSPHDCWGSNLSVHQRRAEIMRVIPAENEDINEVWISDRDRFSYEALDGNERLKHPMIKKDGQWVAVTWLEALETVSNELKKLITQFGPDCVGGLFSPSSTLEEFYLGQKWLRGLGTHNIDHRLRQLDCRGQAHAPLYPNLGLPIAELGQQDMVLLVGSLIQKELPLAALKLRKMVRQGGQVAVINPCAFSYNFDVAHHVVTASADFCRPLAGIVQVLLNCLQKQAPPEIQPLLDGIQPSEEEIHIAEALLKVEKRMVLLGHLALYHPEYSQITLLAQFIAHLIHGPMGQISEGANAAGGWLAGCLPHRSVGGQAVGEPGLSSAEMAQASLKFYLLHNIEPDLDTANGHQSMQAIKKAEYVVALSPFKSDALSSVADVIFPIAAFTENPGTLVNATGIWQTLPAIRQPLGEARPAWKIFRVLGNLCELSGFEFNTLEEVTTVCRAELGEDLGMSHWQMGYTGKQNTPKPGALTRVGHVPIYQIDNIVRRAASLQKTKDAAPPQAYVSVGYAKQNGLAEGDQVTLRSQSNSIQLPVALMTGLPDDCIYVQAAHPQTVALGGLYETVDVERG